MKKLILCLCLISLAILPSMVFAAEGNNFFGQMGDICKGEKNLYVRPEFAKKFVLAKPIIGMDECYLGVSFPVELSTPVGEERYYGVEINPRFVW